MWENDVVAKKQSTAFAIAFSPLSLSGSPDDICYGHDGEPTKDRDKWALFWTYESAVKWAKTKAIDISGAVPYISQVTVYLGQKFVATEWGD